MSIENVIQEHTKAIQDNTVAITLLATAISKINLASVSPADSITAQAAAATGAAANLKAKPPVPKKEYTAPAAANLEVKPPVPKKEYTAPAAAPEPTPEPVVEPAPALTYEVDVKPQLVKVAQLPDGRAKLSNLLAYFKAKTGADLKPEQFQTVLRHAEALLNEPDSLV